MIDYKTTAEDISAEMIEGFFVGWPNPPSPQTHLKLLRQSSHAVMAFDDDANRVIGFITAISDGVLSAYIPFLEVLPPYQNQGIGKELVKRMLARLDHLYMIDLCCDDDLVPNPFGVFLANFLFASRNSSLSSRSSLSSQAFRNRISFC